jgi:hypothetical protein
VVPDKKYVKQTKIVPKRIKFVRKNSIVIPILSVISDGGAETDQRGAETEKFVPKASYLSYSSANGFLIFLISLCYTVLHWR